MEAEIINFVMILFIVVTGITLMLVMVVKIFLRFWQVKNCVDVDLFEVGENCMRKGSYNCLKVKKHINSEFGQYELKELFGKKKFPYPEEHAMVRAKDGKSIICFIEIEGKLASFIPTAKIETAKEDEGSTYHIISQIKDFDSIITKKYWDEITEQTINDGYQDFVYNLGKKHKSIGMLSLFLLIMAGTVIIGAIIWYLNKG